MDTIAFPCPSCEVRLKAKATVAGQSLVCPKCKQRVLVPDSQEEVGGYGLSESSGVETSQNRSSAKCKWCPDGEAVFSESDQATLERARGLARKGEWARTISILNKLQRAPQHRKNTPESAVLSKRISYCLTRWAEEQIEDLEEEGVKLTPPISRLLKEARDRTKVGRVFDFRSCALCGKALKSLKGCTKIATAAGKAYLCCAKPAEEDLEVVRGIDAAWKRLALACQLDADNAEAPALRARLPWWYEILLTSEDRTAWSQRVRGNSPGSGGFIGDADDVLDCLEILAVIGDLASRMG